MAPPIPPNRLPVPYPNAPELPPGAIVGLGALGQVVSTVIGVLIPNWSIGPDYPLPMGTLAKMGPAVKRAVEAQKAKERAIWEQQREQDKLDRETVYNPPPDQQITVPNQTHAIGRAEEPRDKPIGEILRDAAREVGRDAIKKALPPGIPFPSGPGATGREGPPAPNPNSPSAPRSQTVTPPSSPASRLPPWAVPVGIGLGAFAVIGVLNRRRGGSSSATAVLNVPGPIGSGGPLPSPGVNTGVSALLVGGAQGGGGYCEPQPRGPRRKCLERAPVAWRAGRNKGKAAGSKCVRYAQRAS
jgi:hypothetical protein